MSEPQWKQYRIKAEGRINPETKVYQGEKNGEIRHIHHLYWAVDAGRAARMLLESYRGIIIFSSISVTEVKDDE